MLLYANIENRQTLHNARKCNLEHTQAPFEECPKLKTLYSLIVTLNDTKQNENFFHSISMDSIILNENDLKDEDRRGCYVTLMKILVRNLEPRILNDMYDSSTNSFPILTSLLQFCHHTDIMAKNAARISLLIIFKKCDGAALEYIADIVVPKHFSCIISTLKQNILELQNFFKKSCETSIKTACCSYSDELEYVEDIMKLGKKNINIQVRKLMMQYLIIPSILPAITNETENLSPDLNKIGLFLLAKLLNTLTDFEIRKNIGSFITHEFNDLTYMKKHKDKIVETNYNYKVKLKIKLITNLSNILSNPEARISALYVLHLLNTVFKLYASTNNQFQLCLLYKIFLNPLMKNFIYQSNTKEQESMKLKLLIPVLEPLAKQSIVKENLNLLKLRKCFLFVLKSIYLDTCRQILSTGIMDFFILDTSYENFSKNNIDINRVLDIKYLIEEQDDAKGNSKYTPNKIEYCLEKLFHLRVLCLVVNRKKEKTLPLLQKRYEIGKMLPLINCMPCKKLSHGETYTDRHFLKLTRSQMLILQGIGNKYNNVGIIIFNSYYKDITWTKHSNIMVIHEQQDLTKFSNTKSITQISIPLKFKTFSNLHFIISILAAAKQRQIEILQRKVADLLEINSKSHCST